MGVVAGLVNIILEVVMLLMIASLFWMFLCGATAIAIQFAYQSLKEVKKPSIIITIVNYMVVIPLASIAVLMLFNALAIGAFFI